MKILLTAMPDSASCFEEIMQMPNVGLCSIAAHLEGHDVKVLDLILHHRKARTELMRHLEEFRPRVAGISAMTFQYGSAVTAAALVKAFDPRIVTVLGGYHATMLYEEILDGPDAQLFDFLVRGEGEETFPELISALESGGSAYRHIPGISFRENGIPVHNPDRPLLDLSHVKLPKRSARINDTFRFFGTPFDTAETSRGCTHSCGFCSITGMYGRSFRLFPIPRVIEDLRAIRDRGGRGVFLVDDNITLNVPRFKELCGAVIAAGLNDMEFVIQASVAGIVQDPSLGARMREAGFALVFLGIESGLARNIGTLGIEKKVTLENTRRAIGLLHREGIGVLGGMIAGSPDDGAQDIRDTYRYGRSIGADMIMMQTLTPYPKTRLREELLKEGLVTNKDNYSLYNGFIANIKTRRLSTRRLKWLVVKEGIRLYFNPFFIAGSRIFLFRKGTLWPLLKNNFKFVVSGLRGKLFLSRHKWA